MKKYPNQNLLFIVILIGFLFLMLNYENLNPIKKLIEGNTDNESEEVKKLNEEIMSLNEQMKTSLTEYVKKKLQNNNNSQYINEEDIKTFDISWSAVLGKEGNKIEVEASKNRIKIATDLFKKYTEIALLKQNKGSFNYYKNFINTQKKTISKWMEAFNFYGFGAGMALNMKALEELQHDLYSVTKFVIANDPVNTSLEYSPEVARNMMGINLSNPITG